MRVDRVSKEIRKGGKAVDEHDNNLVISNGITEEYAVERRMVEGRDSEPTREHIDKVILNQYDRLRSETSEVDAKGLVAEIPGHNKPQPADSKSK